MLLADTKAGTIVEAEKEIKIVKYEQCSLEFKKGIEAILTKKKIPFPKCNGQDLIFTQEDYSEYFKEKKLLKFLRGAAIGKRVKNKKATPIEDKNGQKLSSFRSCTEENGNNGYSPLAELNFKEIKEIAEKFATHLKFHQKAIAKALSDYECYKVVKDELDRSTELLRNLDKNEEYFQRRIEQVTAFLPLNQPLYATVVFGAIASLMSSKTYVRPPAAMTETFKKLDAIIKFNSHFPNLHISYEDRDAFVRLSQKSDVIIFTGDPKNALDVRTRIKKALEAQKIAEQPLFILNGAGHNPVVIAEEADIKKAVESVLRVCLQNQGQDCAAPNAILVHENNLEKFKTILLEKLPKVKVGPYKDRDNTVGPNTDPKHATKISKFIETNIKDCIYDGRIKANPNIELAYTKKDQNFIDNNPEAYAHNPQYDDPYDVSHVIYPTVFLRSLTEDLNSASLSEFFAPIIMVQPYEKDADLQFYFEHPKYKENAMYVSLFGNSNYVEGLLEKGLHTAESILRNTDLHEAEKGYLPYGGLGPGASCVYKKNGELIPGATLVPREIFNYIVAPAINPAIEAELANSKSVTEGCEIPATNLEPECAPNNVQKAQQSNDKFRRRSVSLGRSSEAPAASNNIDSGLNTPAASTFFLKELTTRISSNASVEDEGLTTEAEVVEDASGNEEQDKSFHSKENQKASPKRKTSAPCLQFRAENNPSDYGRPSSFLSDSSENSTTPVMRALPYLRMG